MCSVWKKIITGKIESHWQTLKIKIQFSKLNTNFGRILFKKMPQ